MFNWSSLCIGLPNPQTKNVDVDCDVAIIGGGLCGLYAAYLLMQQTNAKIFMFEKMAYLGGRIITKRHDNFLIEYGPARFESGVQSKLMKLIFELGIEIEHFSGLPASANRPDYTKLSDEENMIFQTEDDTNHQLPDVLILIMFGIRKILQGQTCNFKKNSNEQTRTKLKQIVRETAKFKGKFLYEYGILDLLKEVLSEECINFILQEGHFYYMIDKNTNAAEHVCMFLDLFALFKWDFVSVKGGMHIIIEKLHRHVSDKIKIHYRNQLLHLEQLKKTNLYKLAFDTGVNIVCKHVIFTVPPDHISHIEGIPRQICNLMKFNLKRVKLFKIFVIIENPPWADGTMELMSDVPCREVQQFVDNSNNEGMLVFYGDEPLRKLWFNSEEENTLSDKETSILLRNQVCEILRISYPDNNNWRIKVIEMNDWYRKPNLGVYLWKPGIQCFPIVNQLAAFSLSGDDVRNVHICGEAFSEYQCFMEGSLRSAENVVRYIMGKDKNVIDIRESIDRILNAVGVYNRDTSM